MRHGATDPFAFEAFVDAWNSFFEVPSASSGELENEAGVALEQIEESLNTDIVAPQIRRMLNAFSNPAFVVRRDGIVLAQNLTAMGRLKVDPGDRIDALPIGLIGGATFGDYLGELFSRNEKDRDVEFCRAVVAPDDKAVTIATFVPGSANAAPKSAIVFAIDPSWPAGLVVLLKEAFGLTDAEAAVLQAFMQGDDLVTIAKARDRSWATIKTQLHTIMTKVGVTTQADLMRNALALSQFQTDIGDMASLARHPHRKRVNLLRDAGRSVEVVLAGDLRGKLVVFLPDATLFTFTAEAEEQFRTAGLCVASIARPGYGGSDPTSNPDYVAAMGEDIMALLDQLGTKRAVLMAHSTSTGYAYRLGGLIAERLEKMVLLSTLVPVPYYGSAGINSPWAGALLRGAQASPRLFKVMVSAGLKTWKVIGSRRFATMQLRANPEDVTLATNPQYLEEQDAAVASISAQGIEHAIPDLMIATRDWADWARACKTPVTLFHGAKNPVAPIDPVRAFAADYPDLIDLVEVSEGGFMVAVSHAQQLMDILAS